MFKKHLKKYLALTAAALTLSVIYISPIKAESAETYLAIISQNTTAILANVNNLPSYLTSLAELAQGWLNPDTSDATANLQSNFTGLANAVLKNTSTQLSAQQKLLSDFFGPSTTPTTLPYANDLTYQTLLGQPYFNPDPRNAGGGNVDSAYNYVKNASGINITHTAPSPTWKGTVSNQIKYSNYYSTISAVQTFNAYVMSTLYADFTNGAQVGTLQTTLMQQASSSDWFTQAASENIGVVLRQILIYDSQIYVTLNQMLQTQRQMLAAQAMSNTLVIIGNQFTENSLLGKATGVQ